MSMAGFGCQLPVKNTPTNVALVEIGHI